ncbi:MAG: WG repeat-containing protein [Leptospiraceae bacterium]|nr:WG repeat-containing protein [Leptospiraceae bacterium]
MSTEEGSKGLVELFVWPWLVRVTGGLALAAILALTAYICHDTQENESSEEDHFSGIERPLPTEYRPTVLKLVNGCPKYGYIDQNNKIRIEAQFDKAYSFDCVRECDTEKAIYIAIVRNSKHWTLINSEGKSQAPAIFTWMSRFSDGLAAAQQVDQGKYGYIDEQGRKQIEFNYEFAFEFSEGLAAVLLPGEEAKWGYIDTTGRLVIQPVFDEAFSFRNGYAVVKIGARFGWIDRDGRFIGNPRYDQIYTDHPDIFFGGPMTVKLNGKWGYLEREGRWIAEPQFESALPFSDGLALVGNEDRVGYINLEGTYEIPPVYCDGLSFSEGIAPVIADCDSMTIGFINKQGEWVAEPQYDQINVFASHYRMRPVRIGAYWGFADETGNPVIQPQYEYAERFIHHLAYVVRSGSEAGYIDEQGQWIRSIEIVNDQNSRICPLKIAGDASHPLQW